MSTIRTVRDPHTGAWTRVDVVQPQPVEAADSPVVYELREEKQPRRTAMGRRAIALAVAAVDYPDIEKD